MLVLRCRAAAFLAVAVAGQTPVQVESALAITNVTVVDVVRGATTPDQTVLITGNRIAGVGPAATARVPKGAEVLDGSRKFLIPGLWDMHSHVVGYGPTSLKLYLAQGVTSVRDMGAERFAEAKEWRDRIAAGELLGPRMRIASPIVENARWLAAVKRMSEHLSRIFDIPGKFMPWLPTAARSIARRWIACSLTRKRQRGDMGTCVQRTTSSIGYAIKTLV